MRNYKVKVLYFLSGVLVTALIFTTSTPALAAMIRKTIEVYTGVNIYIDDVKLNPTDAQGNPVEVFVYNGTTYLPVRAVSEALNKNIQWDGTTQSVFIGKHGSSSSYLLNICPPYQTDSYKAPTTVTVAGKKYSNSFYLIGGWGGGYALFNLDGQYNTLNFKVGHVDNSDMTNGTLNIYLDGNLAYTLDLTCDMLPQQCEIPLNGALQMKVEIPDGTIGMYYAVLEAELS